MRSFRNLMLLAGTILISSCGSDEFDCKEWSNGFRDNSDGQIILKLLSRNGPLIYLYGKNPETGQFIEFYEGSGWFSKIYDQFKVGDTIIKVRGKYTTIIKRKDKTIQIPLICGDNTYHD